MVSVPLTSSFRSHSYRPSESQKQTSYFLVRPPYEVGEHFTRFEPSQASAGMAGAVVGMRLERSGSDWSTLAGEIRQLRQRLPQTPVILLVNLPPSDSLLVTSIAARMHARAVLVDGEPLREGLRTALTRSEGLPEEVMEWLTFVGVRLSPSTLSLIRCIFTLADSHADLHSLLGEAGIPESTARFQLHKRLLPPPSRWFQLARALNVALRIQAQPDRSLLRIALEQGYSDHSALCHQLRRAFHIRPAALRRLLGWEWLLYRWLAACATSFPRQSYVTPAIDIHGRGQVSTRRPG
jgi:AraC-like DNA-binding protein